MGITVEKYMDVSARLLKLGAQKPTGLALLPSNFESADGSSELRQRAEASDVRTLWRNASIVCQEIEGLPRKQPIIQNNSIQWVGPTLFVAFSVWSDNKTLVSLALSVIGNYLTELFKGKPKAEVQLAVIVEHRNGNTFTKIDYSGPVEGLDKLGKVVKDAAYGRR